MNPEVQDRILRFGTASVQNFIKLSSKLFGETIDAPYLLPVGFVGHAVGARGKSPKGQRNLIETLDSLARLHIGSDSSEYSVVMKVQFELDRGLTGGGSIGITTDQAAPKVRVSDDEALDTFSATYDELVVECRNRYHLFKKNRHFNNLMKSVKADPNCVHERRLNPKNKKSTTQMFYNLDTTFAKLDEQYTKLN